jgi:DNA-nicking Smr family endonuclease
MGFRKTPEDDALWRAVTASVQPLGPARKAGPAKRRKIQQDNAGTGATKPERKIARTPVATPVVKPPPVTAKSKSHPELTHGAAPGVDRRTAMKLHRGQMQIQGRLDLHGRTQDDAYRALTSFIDGARGAGRRSVLVITGKGQGVLKSAVPRWLNQPPLRAHVLSFGYAQQRDGGSGALYVLLRKSRGGEKRFKS